MEKVDFLTKKIETTTPIPFDQARSRASKKVGVVVSIAPYAETYASQGAENGHFPIQKKQKGGEGGRLEVEVELSWVPPQVRAQGYQAPVGVVASLGVTMVM